MLGCWIDGNSLTAVWHAFPFWALATGQVCAAATLCSLYSYPSAVMRQTESAQPLWKAKIWGTLLLPVHFKEITIQCGFQLPVSGLEETPTMPFFFFFNAFVPTFCMFLKDGAFHLPTAIANCQLDFFLCVVFSPSPEFVPMQGSQPCVTSKGYVQWCSWSWRKCAQQLAGLLGCLACCRIDGQEIPTGFNSSLAVLASKCGTLHCNSVSMQANDLCSG